MYWSTYGYVSIILIAKWLVKTQYRILANIKPKIQTKCHWNLKKKKNDFMVGQWIHWRFRALEKM